MGWPDSLACPLLMLIQDVGAHTVRPLGASSSIVTLMRGQVSKVLGGFKSPTALAQSLAPRYPAM